MGKIVGRLNLLEERLKMTMRYLQEHQVKDFLNLIQTKNEIYKAIKNEKGGNTLKPTAFLMKEYPQFEKCQSNLVAFMNELSLDALTELLALIYLGRGDFELLQESFSYCKERRKDKGQLIRDILDKSYDALSKYLADAFNKILSK